MQMESIVAQRTGMLCQRVDEATVIMDPETGSYFGLELTSQRIWDRIGQPVSVTVLCEALVSEYEIPRQQCETDVLQFLAQLEVEGLIQVRD